MILFAKIFGLIIGALGLVILVKRQNLYVYLVKKGGSEIPLFKTIILNTGWAMFLVGTGTSIPLILKSIGFSILAYAYMVVSFMLFALITLWPRKKEAKRDKKRLR